MPIKKVCDTIYSKYHVYTIFKLFVFAEELRVEVGDKEMKSFRCKNLHLGLPLAIMNRATFCIYLLFSNEAHFSYDKSQYARKSAYVMQTAKKTWTMEKTCWRPLFLFTNHYQIRMFQFVTFHQHLYIATK